VTDLRVDWCSSEAAAYAVDHWHYSRVMPTGQLAKIGVWEDGAFVGTVIFGKGAAPDLGSRYGLRWTQVCEMVRVALREHVTPTSAIVARALRMLRHQSPGVRLVVSFSDQGHGHYGTLYQAGSWIYTGHVDHWWYRVHGRLIHGKSLHGIHGPGGQSVPWLRAHVDPNAERVLMPAKHRYLMPMDRAMRRAVAPLARPYPRPDTDGDTELLPELDAMVAAVQATLTPDLLLPEYRAQVDDARPFYGHCYVATEALYHLLGGDDAPARPWRIGHEGAMHWWLRTFDDRIVDVTAAQFATPVPYRLGRRATFLTAEPSARARTVINRVVSGGQGLDGEPPDVLSGGPGSTPGDRSNLSEISR
jgi:hypothetical protein